MSDSFRRPHPRCASCRSDDVRPVISGLPTPELEELARRGEVELAGCRVSANTPRWACESCGARFGSWAERRCDSVAIDACSRAARDLTERQAGRPEAHLQEDLAHTISKAAASAIAGYRNVEVTTGRLKLTSGWFPLPGAVDIHVADREHGQLDFVAELKVGAIEQQLWDALKLATVLLTRLEGVRRAYLIAAADNKRFEAGQVRELYAGPIGPWRRHDTTRLLRANQAAWRHDLRHGRGRPEWIPREILRAFSESGNSSGGVHSCDSSRSR